MVNDSSIYIYNIIFTKKSLVNTFIKMYFTKSFCERTNAKVIKVPNGRNYEKFFLLKNDLTIGRLFEQEVNFFSLPINLKTYLLKKYKEQETL